MASKATSSFPAAGTVAGSEGVTQPLAQSLCSGPWCSAPLIPGASPRCRSSPWALLERSEPPCGEAWGTLTSHCLSGSLGARNPPRGPNPSTAPSTSSGAESTLRSWRWRTWKTGQVGLGPALPPPWHNLFQLVLPVV